MKTEQATQTQIYDPPFSRLVTAMQDALGQSNTKYSIDRWDEFVSALHGVIRAFNEMKDSEYQEQLKRLQEAPDKVKSNKAHNKKVDAEVQKVKKFKQFVVDRESALLNDFDYLLGFSVITKREGAEETATFFLKNLYEELDVLANVLYSKRTTALKANVPKPKGKRPYATKSLREALILCLLALVEGYLNIKPAKSSDLKGFNVIGTHVLIHVAEAASDYSYHNYQEFYAAQIDYYKGSRDYWLDCFKDAHLDGYQAFYEFC